MKEKETLQNQPFIAMPLEEPRIWQQGWVCPKCGAVMSPYERSCINCKGRIKLETTIMCNEDFSNPY